MKKKKRYLTIEVVLDGSKLNDGSHGFLAIRAELHHLAACTIVRPERRRGLLQILHGTRALDSSLAKALTDVGQAPEKALWPLLKQARDAGLLSHGSASQYRMSIADERNRFMHRANTFPTNSKEVDAVLGNVGACLTEMTANL